MTTQKIKPILFSTEMVQAILAGRKTQTRRLTGLEIPNQKPSSYEFLGWDKNITVFKSPEGKFRDCEPIYREGNILWVRETFDKIAWEFLYKADDNSSNEFYTAVTWKPSIHMPKEAARIFLKVTDVRVERLQDISGYEVVAEGVGKLPSARSMTQASIDYKTKEPQLKLEFSILWDSINGKKYPWDTNPWVWVYTFEQTEKPENLLS